MAGHCHDDRVAGVRTASQQYRQQNSCKNFAKFFAKEFAAPGTDAALWGKYWKVPDDP